MRPASAIRGNTPRAVLDTSVLLSAHRHWLWLLAHLEYFEGIWSTFIVGEMTRIRVEQAIKHDVERTIYRQRMNDLIHRLSDVLRVAPYRDAMPTELLKDPDDEPILATALAAGADIIVSLNTRDFPGTGDVQGVRFLTPDAFLALLVARHADTSLSDMANDAGRQLP